MKRYPFSKFFSIKNLPFLELIGLKARVLAAENPKNVGLEGQILDETKSFINISGRLIKKRNLILLVELPDNSKALISGDLLLARPEERTKHFLEAEKYAKRSFRLQGSRKRMQ
jgi:RNase P/RNase MRP subunit p29